MRYLELLSRAVTHVGDHLADELGTETLARQAAMSPYHFHRLFRAYFGTTVAGYVTWRRLQRACELLGGGDVSVLDVALAVGYESAQALAKAMRRELDTTPTAVRAGAALSWQRLFERGGGGPPSEPPCNLREPMLKPQFVDTPELWVLTATGRGMQNGNMTRAAQAGFAELWPATTRAGLIGRVRSCIAIFPDEPQGPDDQQARMWTGAIFDHALRDRSGSATKPRIDLHGTLAWRRIARGAPCRVHAHRSVRRVAPLVERSLWPVAAGHRLCLARHAAVRALRRRPTAGAARDVLHRVHLPLQ